MTRKKTATPELLVLECLEDDLSQVQAELFKKAELEMLEFKRKLDSINQAKKFVSVAPPPVTTHSVTPPSHTPVIIQNPASQHNNIMLLEPNSGMHLVMNSLPTSAQPSGIVPAKTTTIRLPAPTTTTSRTPRILTQTRIIPPPAAANPVIRPRPAFANVPPAPAAAAPPPSLPPPAKYPAPPVPSVVQTPTGLTKIQLKPLQPAEINAPVVNKRVLKTKPNDIVDLTDDDNQDSESTADQNEVSIGKVSEKTFPSLVVIVRVFLKSKDITAATANAERVNLDARVKRVLMLTPTTFTEWLLQQGLLKCEQCCSIHRGANGRYNNLKLGMYSDVTKFPFSGGYVWISDCCPTSFVSVFSGSIFEGAPHPPTVLLKLIYHWACQTIVQNVLQWVKVDNLYIKTMYTNLRAVCTAAIHEKYGKLGGNKKKIEVGVISLGTTTQDGHMKHIKVEVLGVLEPDTKRLRLKALEPIADNDRQYMKKKFMKILEPLQQWVEKDSLIITDYTVDRATCHKMGFTNIVQNSHGANSTPEQPTNQTIMDYLRKVIPKMFQNTLSLLSRQIIQQFLDELVWRETWGPIPSRAFDNIILHISEQTRLETGGTLMHRLARIAANPLRNWKYEKWAANCKLPLNNSSSSNREALSHIEISSHIPASQNQLLEQALMNPTQMNSAQMMNSSPVLPNPATPSSHQNQNNQAPMEAAMIALEPYYYGTLIGNPLLTNEKYTHIFKCVMCKDEFRNVMKFTEHLISHAFNKNVRDNSDNKELCKLCLKICPKTNNQNLNTHRMQVHSDRQTCRTLCKICSVKHRDVTSLQSHMISSHCELDMPYHCDICNFRTSILDNIHIHFNTAHVKGTKGYCPYCLKVMQFAELNGRNLENNQLRFVLHIQKHQLTVNRKCEKCLLNFTNRGILKDHQDNWHQSCKLLDDVERYTMDECTLMAAPLIDPLPSSTSSVESSYKGTLKLGGGIEDKFCCECDGLITPDHFVGHLMCSKCRFQTCCNHSMKEHNALVHGTSLLHLRPPIIGHAPVLDNPVYCSCGYSTRNGSYMASHLWDCSSFSDPKRCYTTKRKLDAIEIKKEDTGVPNINDVTDKGDAVMMMLTDKKAVDRRSSELPLFPNSSVVLFSSFLSPTTSSLATTSDVPLSPVNLHPKFNSSSLFNEVKEENMRMAVDDDNDDAMECDDEIEDSMTIDDSSSEAMILD